MECVCFPTLRGKVSMLGDRKKEDIVCVSPHPVCRWSTRNKIVLVCVKIARTLRSRCRVEIGVGKK